MFFVDCGNDANLQPAFIDLYCMTWIIIIIDIDIEKHDSSSSEMGHSSQEQR
jgi:hypothetical protein